MLSLYPSRSLTQNIGLDGSGTHGDLSSMHKDKVSDAPVDVEDIPIVHSEMALKAFVRFNRSFFRRQFMARLRARSLRLAGLKAK